MKKATYTIGEESLQEWESKNESPVYIVLTGKVMSEKVCKILLVLSPMLGFPKHGGNL